MLDLLVVGPISLPVPVLLSCGLVLRVRCVERPDPLDPRLCFAQQMTLRIVADSDAASALSLIPCGTTERALANGYLCDMLDLSLDLLVSPHPFCFLMGWFCLHGAWSDLTLLIQDSDLHSK